MDVTKRNQFRNPKSETSSKFKIRMWLLCAYFDFDYSNLFRISIFEFRIYGRWGAENLIVIGANNERN